MAKKRRRIGSGVREDPGASATATADEGTVATPMAAAVKGSQAKAPQTKDACGTEADGALVALAMRAVRRLCNLRDASASAAAARRAAVSVGGEAEALPEALEPLIAARASKYEEDARAAKLAEAAQGNPANARAGNCGVALSKKRQAPARSGTGGGAACADDGEACQPLGAVDIAEAARVARWLADRPETLASKTCKQLRFALHPLVEARLREEKASPAFRITCALGHRARWPEALRLLSEMRKLEPQRRPKLGAYQRWVREVNAAHGDPQQLAVLDAIMRVAAGLPPLQGGGASPTHGKMLDIPPWNPFVANGGAVASHTLDAAAGKMLAKAAAPPAPPAPPAGSGGDGDADEGKSIANRLSALIAARRGETAAAKTAALKAPGNWSILAHEEAHERLPPNRFDLDIYMCGKGAWALDSPPNRSCERHPVPGVEGAFVLTDVFSADESASLLALTEAIGYRPDVPLSSPVDERAQNVVLFATDEQNDALFARVRDLVPQELEGHRLVGINRRWRIYRYREGNAYRKHLDGAWPASGFRSGPNGRKEYVYDAYGGNTRSRYTFIVYLNDDFEGGSTTYFTPCPGEEGVLEQRPVKPRCGCATVFPHGDFGTPLLHEGSPVLKGAKYLLRTDVVYALPEDTAKMREAKRLRGLARQLGGLGGKDLVDEAMNGVPGDAKVAGASRGTKGKVIKNKMKANKFREKQDAKRAKEGTNPNNMQEGKGGPMRFNRIGKRPPKRNSKGGSKRR